MKKYLSLILAAAMSLSALAPAVVSAEGEEGAVTAATLDNMVVLGDSISSGHGLGENEYSYAEIAADYFGADLANFAEDGLNSSELRDMLQNPDENKKQAIMDSEVVIISIGSNDLVHAGAKQILNFAAKNGLLNEGYTEADIPEDPGTYAVTTMLDMKALKDFANGGMENTLALNAELAAFSLNLQKTEGTNAYGENQGIIHNVIMANIQESINSIKEINPDAQIIVQTLYQPFQLSPDYVSKHGSGYASMLTQLRFTLNNVTDTFRQELMQIEDIEVIDVLQTFTALEDISDSSNATPGYAYYFTNVQDADTSDVGAEATNIHPNQKGHLAIASLLLEKIKVKDEETGELVSPAPAERPVDDETGMAVPTVFDEVYDSIENIEDYPPLAMEQIVESIPDRVIPGDVNGDGYIDAIDATAILVEYASLSVEGSKTTLTEEENKRADVNYDGFVDANDATLTSMYYAYLATEHEGETLNIFSYMNKLRAE